MAHKTRKPSSGRTREENEAAARYVIEKPRVHGPELKRWALAVLNRREPLPQSGTSLSAST